MVTQFKFLNSNPVKAWPAAQEFFALAKDLENLFHFGDGRIIFRSLSKEIEGIGM